MRAETIIIKEIVRVSDGGAGSVGELTPIWYTRANWGSVKGTRQVEESKISIPLGYWFIFWANPLYPVRAGSIVEYDGADYTVQSVEYLDDRKRQIKITTIQA